VLKEVALRLFRVGGGPSVVGCLAVGEDAASDFGAVFGPAAHG
jgi:hypothetical protein